MKLYLIKIKYYYFKILFQYQYRKNWYNLKWLKNNGDYKKLLTFLDILKGLENWRLRVLSMERGESVTDLFRHIFVLSQSFLKQTIYKNYNLVLFFFFTMLSKTLFFKQRIQDICFISLFRKNNIVFLF